MTERELLIVKALADNFYKIVPLEYRTFCSLTSRISKAVLLHFGIKAELLPCQIWLVTPEQNFVVGFTGKPATPKKWDGHVVCSGENFIIDAALYHFTREFDLNVPHVAATPRFLVPTQVIAQLHLNAGNGLWWHCPPTYEGIDMNIPDEPQEVITKFSAQLIEHMSGLGTIDVENLAGQTQEPAGFSLPKM
jgi:hypothetical protein